MEDFLSKGELEEMKRSLIKKDMELVWEAKKRARINELMSFWKYKFNSDPKYLIGHITGPLKEEIKTYCARKKGCQMYKYVFVTVNPRDDVDFELFKKKVEKAAKKCWIDKYMYCYETRGSDGKGYWKGIHMHMKIWLSEKKDYGSCKREMYNTFKNLVDHPKHVHVDYSNRDDCYEEYIKGIKKGEKKKCYDDDGEFREYWDLPPFFSS